MLVKLKDIYKQYIPSKHQQLNFPVTLQNLFTTLEEFQTNHCLLVINNWQGVDTKQTSAIPSVLKKLDLTLYHRKFVKFGLDFEELVPVLLPTKIAFAHKNFYEVD